jgi:RNA polymerase sigma-70 factor (ECF subfamily)
VTASEADPVLALRAAQVTGAPILLVTRHGGSLAQAARAFGMPETDVDDVVQESFIAAWRNLASMIRRVHFGDGCSASRSTRCAICGVGIVCALFCLAQTDRRSPDVADDAPGRAQCDRRQRTGSIRAKLRRLDGGLGEALVLTAIIGMTQPEAALALNIS